jgi:hypothetical protein
LETRDTADWKSALRKKECEKWKAKFGEICEMAGLFEVQKAECKMQNEARGQALGWVKCCRRKIILLTCKGVQTRGINGLGKVKRVKKVKSRGWKRGNDAAARHDGGLKEVNVFMAQNNLFWPSG